MERIDEIKREYILNGLKILQEHCRVQKNCDNCICMDICHEIKDVTTFEWVLPNHKEIRNPY